MGRQKRAEEEEEELLGVGQLDARAAGNAGGAGGGGGKVSRSGGGAANAAGEERAEASCLVRAVGRRLKQSSLVNGKQK